MSWGLAITMTVNPWRFVPHRIYRPRGLPCNRWRVPPALGDHKVIHGTAIRFSEQYPCYRRPGEGGDQANRGRAPQSLRVHLRMANCSIRGRLPARAAPVSYAASISNRCGAEFDGAGIGKPGPPHSGHRSVLSGGDMKQTGWLR